MNGEIPENLRTPFLRQLAIMSCGLEYLRVSGRAEEDYPVNAAFENALFGYESYDESEHARYTLASERLFANILEHTGSDADAESAFSDLRLLATVHADLLLAADLFLLAATDAELTEREAPFRTLENELPTEYQRMTSWRIQSALDAETGLFDSVSVGDDGSVERAVTGHFFGWCEAMLLRRDQGGGAPPRDSDYESRSACDAMLSLGTKRLLGAVSPMTALGVQHFSSTALHGVVNGSWEEWISEVSGEVAWLPGCRIKSATHFLSQAIGKLNRWVDLESIIDGAGGEFFDRAKQFALNTPIESNLEAWFQYQAVIEELMQKFEGLTNEGAEELADAVRGVATSYRRWGSIASAATITLQAMRVAKVPWLAPPAGPMIAAGSSLLFLLVQIWLLHDHLDAPEPGFLASLDVKRGVLRATSAN